MKSLPLLLFLAVLALLAGGIWYFSTASFPSSPNNPTNHQGALVPIPKPYDQTDPIIEPLSKGDVVTLSKYFAEEIDLNILEEEELLLKAEASERLTQFYNEFPDRQFSLVHNGQSQSGKHRYIIGNYKVPSDLLRTYVGLRGDTILEIRIQSNAVVQ